MAIGRCKMSDVGRTAAAAAMRSCCDSLGLRAVSQSFHCWQDTVYVCVIQRSGSEVIATLRLFEPQTQLTTPCDV
jgi:hypothetical protein